MVIKGPTEPCIYCHTALWNNNAVKQAINDKVQGSVVTYLRCGGVVNNQIKKKFLNRWIFGKVTSNNVVASCTLCTCPPHCWKTKKAHETTNFLLVILPNIHRFKKNSISLSCLVHFPALFSRCFFFGPPCILTTSLNNIARELRIGPTTCNRSLCRL